VSAPKTDDELNALFAEHVAGTHEPIDCFVDTFWGKPIYSLKDKQTGEVSRHWIFATDANAVLPWLDKMGRWECGYGRHTGGYSIYFPREPVGEPGEADTFPRAAVIALLRAKGIEV
jgi:hypothetical protein